MERKKASTDPGAVAALTGVADALAGLAASLPPLPLRRLLCVCGVGGAAFAFLAALFGGGGEAARGRLAPLAPLPTGCGGSSTMRLSLGAFRGSTMPRTVAALRPRRSGSAGSS